MHQECIHVQHKVHILEPVIQDNVLIQILMYKCEQMYMQRGEGSLIQRKTSQTTIKNTDQDYQNKFCHKQKEKKCPGPAFDGPV